MTPQREKVQEQNSGWPIERGLPTTENYNDFQNRYRPRLHCFADGIGVCTNHHVDVSHAECRQASKDGWRASKLAGVDVYNEQNEKIGDVSDVILDQSGKASAVIIGVGGFLGVGEHLVSVPFDNVKWVAEPVRSTTALTNSQNTTGSAATTGTTRGSNDNWYPDHATYSAAKDQLKQLPEFKY